MVRSSSDGVASAAAAGSATTNIMYFTGITLLNTWA